MSGWGTPPSDAHTTFKTIATYDCIRFNGTIGRTWREDLERDRQSRVRRDAAESFRLQRVVQRIRLIFPRRRLPILKPSALVGFHSS